MDLDESEAAQPEKPKDDERAVEQCCNGRFYRVIILRSR